MNLSSEEQVLVSNDGLRESHSDAEFTEKDSDGRGEIGTSGGEGGLGGSTSSGALNTSSHSQTPNRSRWRGSRGSAPNGVDGSYEEFFSGTVPCPSCRGIGRIPKEQEQQLVALIPLNDSRLKPRRTMLYVFIAVCLCLVIGGLLLFFLLPRTVQLNRDISKIYPVYSKINLSEEYVFLTLRVEYNVTNNNYFGIDVNQMQVTTLWDTKVMAEVTNQTMMSVPLRSEKPYSVDLNVTFANDEGYIAVYCDKESAYAHSLLMPFNAVATFGYLGHVEEATYTAYLYVICSEQPTSSLVQQSANG